MSFSVDSTSVSVVSEPSENTSMMNHVPVADSREPVRECASSVGVWTASSSETVLVCEPRDCFSQCGRSVNESPLPPELPQGDVEITQGLDLLLRGLSGLGIVSTRGGSPASVHEATANSGGWLTEEDVLSLVDRKVKETEERMEKKMKAMEERIEKEMKEREERLERKLRETEERLTREMEERIDNKIKMQKRKSEAQDPPPRLETAADIREAIERGDWESDEERIEGSVRRMVQGGGNVNGTASLNGESLLHKAARKDGSVGLLFVRALLRAGANPVAARKDGKTPIDVALLNGCVENLRALIEKVGLEGLLALFTGKKKENGGQSKKKKKSQSGRCMSETLHKAVGIVCPRVLKGLELIQEFAGSCVFVQLRELLHHAAESKNSAAFPLLIHTGGGSVEQEIACDFSELVKCAVSEIDIDAVKALLAANKNKRGGQHITFEMSSCGCGCSDSYKASIVDWVVHETLEERIEGAAFLSAVVDELRQYPEVDLQRMIKTNSTPISEHDLQPEDSVMHRAAADGRTDVLEVLVGAGGKLGCVDAVGKTPLFRALEERHNDTCRALVQWGAVWTKSDESQEWRMHCDPETDDSDSNLSLWSLVSDLRAREGFRKS